MGLYEKIKFLADKQKISIRRLEEILGYGNGTIRRWEKQTPGVDKIQKVADHFGVSVDYLLGRTDNPNLKDKSSRNEPNKPKVKILARKMNDLDDSQLDALDNLIDNFFDQKFNKKD